MTLGVAGDLENGGAGARPHFVYLIGNGIGHVKIGRGRDPKARRTEMATGSSTPLEVLYDWPMSERRARKIEAAMHGFLDFCRLHGEWFEIKPAHAIAFGHAMLSNDPDRIYDTMEKIATLHGLQSELEEAKIAVTANRSRETRAERLETLALLQCEVAKLDDYLDELWVDTLDDEDDEDDA